MVEPHSQSTTTQSCAGTGQRRTAMHANLYTAANSTLCTVWYSWPVCWLLCQARKPKLWQQPSTAPLTTKLPSPSVPRQTPPRSNLTSPSIRKKKCVHCTASTPHQAAAAAHHKQTPSAAASSGSPKGSHSCVRDSQHRCQSPLYCRK